MPKLPGICNKCKKAHLTDYYIRDDTYHLRGMEAGRCSCGGRIVILDGTYVHLGGPLNFCRAPKEEVLEFRRIMQDLGQDYFVTPE